MRNFDGASPWPQMIGSRTGVSAPRRRVLIVSLKVHEVESNEPHVSLEVAGLGLAATELTSSAVWCVTHESHGPVRVPFPGSVRTTQPTTSTWSLTSMA